MLGSLRSQVLWAPVAALVALLAIAGFGLLSRDRATNRIRAVGTMREQLDRVTSRLSERHNRTMRRVREAMLEPRPSNQVALLSRTAEHYRYEMGRLVTNAKTTLVAVAGRDLDGRWSLDRAHLDGELDRIGERAQLVAPTIDALLEAVAAEDPELIAAASQDLDRADRDMVAELRTTESMVQRIGSLHTRPPTLPIAQTTWLLLLAGGLVVLIAVGLAYRPLARLARMCGQLQRREPPTAPRSDEEHAIHARVAELTAQAEVLETNLSAQLREAERSLHLQRRAEHELALLKLYDENLVNSLRSAIVVTDASGRISGVNRAARALLGIDAAAVGTPISEHPLSRALQARGAETELERARDEKRTVRFEALSYPGPQSESLLDVMVSPYLDESGAARGMLWVADDVTDAVRVKNQLLEAERLAAVGRLSAQVAHEIRNPLSAIGLNAELLAEDFAQGLDEPRRREATALLGAIASEVERLTQVTEGYLRLTRLPHPSFRDVDLNALVVDLMTMLAEELKSHRIEVALELAHPAPHAWADPGQLRQALLNIIRNGREAMPDGGSLRVSTANVRGESAIVVCDSGPGVPSSLVGRVFEPFFTTKPDGTGLGLSLTRQIILEHGGDVELRPGSPVGTTVVLALPAGPRPNEGAAQAEGY